MGFVLLDLLFFGLAVGWFEVVFCCSGFGGFSWAFRVLIFGFLFGLVYTWFARDHFVVFWVCVFC